jgi:hypothetical protein
MPFIIRIILQRTLAVGISFLAFFGINPTIPTDNEINITNQERQEVISTILSDIENQVVNLDKNLLQDLVTPKKSSDSNKKTNIPNTNGINKNLPIIPEIKPSKDSGLEILPETVIQSEKPIDVIIETINDEILPKNKTDLNLASVLVNIICTEKKGNYITANTGSGVIISANGVVLTNAHVAQYFLLDKEPANYQCALYQENIPTYGYVAKLLYISPDWIKNNPEVIISKNPRGTGENDYALLYITKNTNPALPKPKSFEFAKFNTNYSAEIGDQINLAGFPGSPVSLGDLTRSVGLKKDSTQIEDIFTFGNNQIDVISTGVTPVAARGASGGGLFKNNELIALIVTTSGSVGNAYINAITTNYINRDLQKDFGKNLNQLINENLENESENFWNTYGKDLAKIILAEL